MRAKECFLKIENPVSESVLEIEPADALGHILLRCTDKHGDEGEILLMRDDVLDVMNFLFEQSNNGDKIQNLKINSMDTENKIALLNSISGFIEASEQMVWYQETNKKLSLIAADIADSFIEPLKR